MRYAEAGAYRWFMGRTPACASTDLGPVERTGAPADKTSASRDLPPSSERQLHGGSREPKVALVMVIDDEPDHRSMMREVLEEEGYSVETAEHGADGLGQLRAGLRPDVIVLDLRMPVMDGWTFLKELKREASFGSIPIVVTTQAGERVLASAPVSAGYLAKPFEAHRLIETVQACLERRRRT
jgi:two-component system chemotaxis response regulator CheY